MTTLQRLLLGGLSTVLLTAPTLAPGAAVAATHEFGEHVADHAVERMLDGGCNPGMHRGISGWADHDECA